MKRSLVGLLFAPSVALSAPTTTTTTTTQVVLPPELSGHYELTGNSFNCPDAPSFNVNDLKNTCGSDIVNPCPIAIRLADPGACGHLYKIASLVDGKDKVVIVQVVHLDDTMEQKFGLMTGALRELCPFVCESDHDKCVGSPLECAGKDEVVHHGKVVKPTMSADGQLMPGSRIMGMRALSYSCITCPLEDGQGTIPEPDANFAIQLAAPLAVNENTTLTCDNNNRISAEEALDASCGTFENPCTLVHSLGYFCDDRHIITLYAEGLDDPDGNVCKDGGCENYQKSFHVKVKSGSLNLSKAQSHFPVALCAQFCPHMCALQNGQASGVCAQAEDCLHGVVGGKTENFPTWGNYFLPGSMEDRGTQVVASKRRCNDYRNVTDGGNK